MWVTDYDSGFKILTFIKFHIFVGEVQEGKAKIPIPNQSKPNPRLFIMVVMPYCLNKVPTDNISRYVNYSST